MALGRRTKKVQANFFGDTVLGAEEKQRARSNNGRVRKKQVPDGSLQVTMLDYFIGELSVNPAAVLREKNISSAEIPPDVFLAVDLKSHTLSPVGDIGMVKAELLREADAIDGRLDDLDLYDYIRGEHDDFMKEWAETVVSIGFDDIAKKHIERLRRQYNLKKVKIRVDIPEEDIIVSN